jgi:hypothetical protein
MPNFEGLQVYEYGEKGKLAFSIDTDLFNSVDRYLDRSEVVALLGYLTEWVRRQPVVNGETHYAGPPTEWKDDPKGRILLDLECILSSTYRRRGFEAWLKRSRAALGYAYPLELLEEAGWKRDDPRVEEVYKLAYSARFA